jgi:hypothetical protein
LVTPVGHSVTDLPSPPPATELGSPPPETLATLPVPGAQDTIPRAQDSNTGSAILEKDHLLRVIPFLLFVRTLKNMVEACRQKKRTMLGK